MVELMLGAPLLWTTIAIPAAAGLVSLLLGRSVDARSHAVLAAFSWGLSFSILVALVPYVYSSKAVHVILDPWYAEVPGLGTFALMVDGASLVFALSIAAVSMAIAIYSYRYMTHRFEELGTTASWGLYYFLYQLFTIGMLGVVYSTNTVLFYLFLELTLIPSFLLITLYGYGDRVHVGLLYLVWTHAGAALFLLSILLIGFTSGIFDIYVPGLGYVVNIERVLGPVVAIVAFVLLVVGLAVKMALFGLHMWLPYAHAEAPTPISALLSPLLIGLGAYGLFRIATTYFPHLWHQASPYLVLWAFITMAYGGLMALTQDDVKRFLAYSSISQMGYLLLGLATTTTAGLSGALLHYMSHAFGKAVLFAVAGILIVVAHTRSLHELGGIASKLPYAAAAALAGFLYLTGVPPALGLLSEYLIARGLAVWASTYGFWTFIASLAGFMIAITVSTLYSFVGFKRMFLSKPGPAYNKIKEVEPSSMIGPVLFLALLGVIVFLAPEPVVGPLKAVTSLVAGLRG